MTTLDRKYDTKIREYIIYRDKLYSGGKVGRQPGEKWICQYQDYLKLYYVCHNQPHVSKAFLKSLNIESTWELISRLSKM